MLLKFLDNKDTGNFWDWRYVQWGWLYNRIAVSALEVKMHWIAGEGGGGWEQNLSGYEILELLLPCTWNLSIV